MCRKRWVIDHWIELIGRESRRNLRHCLCKQNYLCKEEGPCPAFALGSFGSLVRQAGTGSLFLTQIILLHKFESLGSLRGRLYTVSLLVLLTLQPLLEPLKVQVHHRRNVERQCLRNDQTADHS